MRRKLIHAYSDEARCDYCCVLKDNAVGDACFELRLQVERAYAAEHVTCAAVWIDDGVPHVHQSVPTGVVIGGWRHPNCIDTVAAVEWPHGEVRVAQKDQGFLTSRGRFVGREEAAKLAWAAGQTFRELTSLTSEDLY